MNIWKEFAVCDICEEIIDCVNKTAPRVEYITPYKMIRTTNVRNGRIDLENVFYVEESVYLKWIRRGKPQVNDVILTREAPVGEVGILRSEENVFLGQRTMMYKANESIVDPFFLYYSLKSDFIQDQLKSFSSGSTVAHVKVPHAQSFKVKLPPLPTQRRIASILSAYDDLIENNLKRIRLLEEAAQNIYREWFVHFRFPGHEKTKMGENGLPEGWSREIISKVTKINNNNIGRNYPYDEILYVDITSTNSGSYEAPARYSLSGAPGRAKRILSHGDIIFSTVRPNRKIYSLILDPPSNLVASTGFAVISPNRNSEFSFLYSAIKDDDFINQAISVAKGSTYPAISQSDFELIVVVWPNEELIDMYNCVCGSIYQQVGILLNTNAILCEARDVLLPRLMNQTISI